MAATNNTTPNGSNSNGVHSNGTIPPLPILIAGGGCVGLFLALLLSQSAIPNPIIVIEPLHPDPHSTRAMAHQPLIFSLFARADLMPEFSRLGSFSSGLCFRTSAKNGSKLIAGKQFKEGEKAQLLLAQGRFQEVLMRRLAEGGKGECRVGWELVGFEEREESVHVKIRDEDGREETIETEYLIGADGAHSRVRKLLDMPFNGETLPTQLVATDIIYDFHAHGFYDANFVIDPENYGLIGRINNDGMWRVSYGVPLETSDEDIHAGVGEKLRKMMPDGGSSGFEVKRVAPYKAQQRCVDKFWKGRVGLVGDAAHLTNPYAGLGLASGIADTSSLADVLIRILSHDASNPTQLLSSWSDARREKFLNVVDKPSRMAYKRVQSKVDEEGGVEALLERDGVVGALKRGMPTVPPSLETRGEGLIGW